MSIQEHEGAAHTGRPGLTRLVLLAGDSAAFLLFAAIGRRSHGEAAGLAAAWEVFQTAAPFLLGWLLVAPWTRAYRVADYEPGQPAAPVAPALPQQEGSHQRWPAFAGWLALVWLLAWPVGLGLRALFLQRGIPLSFALVTFISNLVLLVGWRSLFAWFARGRRSG